MINLPQYISPKRLAVENMENADPGTLLVQALQPGKITPWLTVRDQSESRPRAYALPLASDTRNTYRMIPVNSVSGRWLSIDDWELVVDPTTAYEATVQDTASGDAFISAGNIGLVCRFNDNELYVSVGGLVLPEPDWAKSFVGFRSWAIRIQHDETSKLLTLLERSPPQSDL